MATQLKSIHIASDAENASFAEAVEQLTCLIEAGDHSRATQFIDENPQHADQLRRLLPAIEALASLGFTSAQLDRPVEGLGHHRRTFLMPVRSVIDAPVRGSANPVIRRLELNPAAAA